MAFDNEFFNEIKSKIDIVKVISAYQSIVQKGKGYIGECPFHNDTNPSMHINVEKQIFKCFSCGAGGDAIKYVMKREGCSYMEALKKACEICGYHDERLEISKKLSPEEEKKIPLYKCLDDLTNYYQYSLNTQEADIAREYLKKRQLDEAMINKYKIGYASKDGKKTIAYLQSKGHSLKTIETLGLSSVRGGDYFDKNTGRLIFTLCDKDGKTIGYSARTLTNEDAKYINTQETPLFYKSKVLYNYHIAKERCHIDGYIYVLEGFMDVIALSRIGIDSAVAIMGTALTEEHIALLRRLNVEVRLCLDGDKAGQDATFKNSKLLENAKINFRIVNTNNNKKDPDEIFFSEGPNALREYLNKLVNRLDFALNYYLNTNPLSTIEQKKQLIKAFTPILAKIDNALEYDSYCRKISAITGYAVESIKEVVSQAKRNNFENSKKLIEEHNPEKKVLKKLSFIEREMLYQMTNHKDAVIYYEEFLPPFNDDNYRKIANYLVDYASNHDDIDLNDIIFNIEQSGDDNIDTLVNELTSLQFEKNHLKKCDDKVLKGLHKSINEERTRIKKNQQIKQALIGEDELAKAKILNELNKK